MPAEHPATAVAVSGAVAVGAFLLCLRYLRRGRDVENTPLSLVRSAAQGAVELEGNVRLMPGPPIVSPLSNIQCVWWSYKIEHREPGKKNVEVIARGTSDELFHLDDGTGCCIVDPLGAEVLPSLQRSWRGAHEHPGIVPRSRTDAFFTFGPYTYTERLLQLGDHIYAQGWFRTQTAVQESDQARVVSSLLAEWKQDQLALLRRFDRDGDGRLNPEEWEAARQAAIDEVQAQQAERAPDQDLNVLGKPPDHRPYVLAAMPRGRLASRYRRLALLFLVVAAAAAALSAHLISAFHLLGT
jgi:E3 ubiquitin ligase